MVGIFKQKSPANTLLLFGYALVLKLPVFLHPWLPGLHEQDNYLYRFILSSLHSIFGGAVWIYGVLAFLMLFAQAILLWLIAAQARTDAWRMRPFIFVFLAAFIANAIIAAMYFFAVPCAMASIVALCLLAAWMTAKRPRT